MSFQEVTVSGLAYELAKYHITRPKFQTVYMFLLCLLQTQCSPSQAIQPETPSVYLARCHYPPLQVKLKWLRSWQEVLRHFSAFDEYVEPSLHRPVLLQRKKNRRFGRAEDVVVVRRTPFHPQLLDVLCFTFDLLSSPPTPHTADAWHLSCIHAGSVLSFTLEMANCCPIRTTARRLYSVICGRELRCVRSAMRTRASYVGLNSKLALACDENTRAGDSHAISRAKSRSFMMRDVHEVHLQV